ncbi:protein translocase subunit SecD [Burkholderiaceae bacterium DAT-1]|nr:protein translocase subunit SecD [Burkholderiaceae bacterium DAT-1]
MNRYPLWKYAIIVLTLVFGTIFAVPNIYGRSPALQVAGVRSDVLVNNDIMKRVEQSLAEAKVDIRSMHLEKNSLSVHLVKADQQLHASDLLQKALGDQYVVAQNTVSDAPEWLSGFGAKPMSLGLDLRGGVHFLLEVDMKAAIDKAYDRLAGDAKRELREAKIYAGAIKRVGQVVEVQVRDAELVDKVVAQIAKKLPTVQAAPFKGEGNNRVVLTYTQQEILRIQSDAVQQNVSALNKRINELGVAEPQIQQQGVDRISVDLPGVNDPTRAKELIGRTAALEVHLVEDDAGKLADAMAGNVPPGFVLMDYMEGRGRNTKILLKKDIELTGDNINDAQTGFNDRNEPAVHVRLDSAGASIFRQVSRENLKKRLAMVLVEKGKGEVVTAPVIQQELGANFSISGAMDTIEANNIAILLRSGSLAAPMNVVEERSVGPSLGAENITKGFTATLYGFGAVVVFMLIYYRAFGFTAAIALAANLIFLVAMLSLLGVVLTLPGIAAIALTLGMAIDSNVLINERIREEIRAGMSPHASIKAGYEHAWATILDSNITTLVVGVSLLIFGSGAIRGFAWVHCMGILTSMFSAVFLSRGVVSLIYGYRRKLQSLAV